MMKNFANDLHRKGELNKINKMNKLADQIELDTNGGLAGAYLTNGFKGKFDVIGMIAQSPDYSVKEGYVFYDNEQDKAVFINDETLDNL